MQTGYVAKKAARRSRRLCPVPSERRGLPRFARAPKFRIPRNPRATNQSVRRGVSGDPSLGDRRSSLDAKIEWIESTEDKLLPVNAEIFDPEQRTTRAQRLIENDINAFFTRSLNPFGG